VSEERYHGRSRYMKVAARGSFRFARELSYLVNAEMVADVTWAAIRTIFAALGEVHLYQRRRDASTSRGNRHLGNGGTKPPRRCSLRRWHAELCRAWPIFHNPLLLFGNHTAHKTPLHHTQRSPYLSRKSYTRPILSPGRLQTHYRPERGRITLITDSIPRGKTGKQRCIPP